MYSKVIISNHRQGLVDKYKEYGNVLTNIPQKGKIELLLQVAK